MIDVKTDIQQRALALPIDARQELVETLLTSIEQEAADIELEWRTEIRKRITQIESGDSVLLPAEDVLEELRDRCGVRHGPPRS